MKIYLAARYTKRDEMENVANKLTDLGFEITARWVYGGEAGLSRKDIALLDIEDVDKADTVVSFTEPYGTHTPGGGRHVEFGYGLAKGKRCVVIGELENVFHHHPWVIRFDSLEAFIDSYRL